MYKQRLNLAQANSIQLSYHWIKIAGMGALSLGLLKGGKGTLSPFSSGAAYAQTVTADDTIDTQVNLLPLSEEGFVITGGAIEGSHLFHSFETFSPNTFRTVFALDAAAYAGAADEVSNIFSRVTGASESNLNGLLEVSGGNNPNFFLLNPNGVLLGPNVALDIPGSIFLSTANSVLFEDGAAFMANDIAADPLLTISAPVGIQFGAASEPISTDGRFLSSAFSFIQSIDPDEIYKLTADTTLTLLGGDITLSDTYFNVPSGRIQLGSVGPNAQVTLEPITHALTYAADTPLQDIFMMHSALNTNGDGGGNIAMTGRRLQMTDAGLISETNGAENGGLTALTFSEQIDLKDSLIVAAVFPLEPATPTDPVIPVTGRGGSVILETDGQLTVEGSLVFAETYSAGDAGDLTIQAKDILLLGDRTNPDDFTTIASATFDAGDGGNLTVRADSLTARGFLSVDAATYSASLGPLAGDGKTLSVSVDYLVLEEGAQVGTGTFGDGNSGDLIVEVTRSADISGRQILRGYGDTTEDTIVASGLFTSAEPGSTGNGGNMWLTTPRLSVRQGGTVNAITLGEGNAGNITIRAADIAVSGPTVDELGIVSGIVAAVSDASTGNGGQLDIVSDRLHLFNGGRISVSTDGGGNAGDINIRSGEIEIEGTSADGLLVSSIASSSTTEFDAGSVTLMGDRLSIRDQGTVSVSSLGGGSAGDVTVAAGEISLNNGSIQAEANTGNRGNLTLEGRDFLLMRQGSRITTDATEVATGGNIAINSPLVIGLENSDISANAVEGNGGNIRLVTQSLVGLEFREQLTPQSDITASSEFGINGLVNIESPNVDAESGLVQLPQNLEDASDQVTASCQARAAANQFAISGRGGLPDSPLQPLGYNSVWLDLRESSNDVSEGDVSEGDVSEGDRYAERAADTISFSSGDGAIADTPIEPAIAEAKQWQVNAAGEVELLAARPLASSPHACLEPVERLS